MIKNKEKFQGRVVDQGGQVVDQVGQVVDQGYEEDSGSSIS